MSVAPLSPAPFSSPAYASVRYVCDDAPVPLITTWRGGHPNRQYRPLPVRASSAPVGGAEIYTALYETLLARWSRRAKEIEHNASTIAEREADAAKRQKHSNETEIEREPIRNEDASKMAVCQEEIGKPERIRDDDTEKTVSKEPSPISASPVLKESSLIKWEGQLDLIASQCHSEPIPTLSIFRPNSPELISAISKAATSFSRSEIRPVAHRPSARSEALVNVVKSFEAVLECRAEGWRRFAVTMRDGSIRRGEIMRRSDTIE